MHKRTKLSFKQALFKIYIEVQNTNKIIAKFIPEDGHKSG